VKRISIVFAVVITFILAGVVLAESSVGEPVRLRIDLTDGSLIVATTSLTQW